ncbi:MAG: tripartite tricarboxylate transporter TctB family protein [Casimicrobiaceae bacterium]
MSSPGREGGGDVQTRWVELVVALLVVAGGIVVIVDALRVGIAWGEYGPKAGYFPFYIGCMLVASGGWIAARTLMAWGKLAGETFVTRAELRPVLQMLLPTVVYVIVIYFLGIYVASAIYIAGFMLWQGKFKWPITLATSLGVPIALFLLFEVWFLVPLPKGPFEQFIGY